MYQRMFEQAEPQNSLEWGKLAVQALACNTEGKITEKGRKCQVYLVDSAFCFFYTANKDNKSKKSVKADCLREGNC